ncbi:MAG: hypothetical protein QOD77_1092 [Thermoplasmata archaeon]|nr:hypothetical protein [Thermoplasmata archaeon]
MQAVRAAALVAVLLLAGCAAPGHGKASTSSTTATRECRTSVEFEPASCGACPWTDGCPVPPLDDPLEVELSLADGAVQARNLGTRTFHYNAPYAACDLTYHTATGRQSWSRPAPTATWCPTPPSRPAPP